MGNEDILSVHEVGCFIIVLNKALLNSMCDNGFLGIKQLNSSVSIIFLSPFAQKFIESIQ
jgi:hypothetical protein